MATGRQGPAQCLIMLAALGIGTLTVTSARAQQTPGPYGEVHDRWNWLDVGFNFAGAEVTATIGSVVLPVHCIGPTGPTLYWSDPTNWNDVLVPYQRVKEVYDFVTDPGHVNLVTTNLGDFSTAVPFQDFMAMGPSETSVSIPIPLQGYGIPATVNIGTRVEYIVTIDGSRTVRLDQDSTLRSLVVGGIAALQVLPNKTLVLRQESNNIGTMNVAGSLVAQAPFVTGGSFSLSGSLRGEFLNTGNFEWSGGSINGTLTNASNTFIISGTERKVLGGDGVLTNNGTITQMGNASVRFNMALYNSSAAILNNQAGAVYDLQGDSGLEQGDHEGYYANQGRGTFNNAGTFRKSGGTGTSSISGAIAFNNTGTVEVTSGTLAIGSGTSTDGRFVFANGGTLIAPFWWSGTNTANGDGVLQVSGWVGEGNTAAFSSFTNGARLVIGSGRLSIGRGSTLTIDGPFTNDGAIDVAGRLIVVPSSDDRDEVLSQLTASIISGRDGGRWTGAGITSSAARGDPFTGLAIALNDQGGGKKLWKDEEADAILIKYTWNGDVNLDGAINLNDYFIVDSNYIAQGSDVPVSYAQGDVNYDGAINLNDYFLIDSAYLGQRGVLSMVAAATSVVPEPSGAVVLLAGVAGVLRRRQGVR
jgi:hypothetical protein